MGPLYDVGVRAECALGSRKRFARHRVRRPPSSHDGGGDDGIRGHAGAPRAMMSIVGPCIGVVSGIVFGLFALLATWLVGRGGKPAAAS